MVQRKNSIILKIDFEGEQTVGEITKITGLIKAKQFIPIVDFLNLDANPRSAKTGPVTDDIQESAEHDTEMFPFKTKGILLASAQYEKLERDRIRLIPQDAKIEGILDGGHNTLAIGLYILDRALACAGKALPRGAKTWDEFKYLWKQNRADIDQYVAFLKKENDKTLDFYVPMELLVPRDPDNYECVETFKNNLLEICAARNNNVQLQLSAKANQKGYFDVLKQFMMENDPEVYNRIEWKTNDGGNIKVQDLIALAWIPLNIIMPVKDGNGREIEPISPQKMYSGKGSCMKQFDKLMSSPLITAEADEDYRRQLTNKEVESALRVAVDLPALYDYIYEMFPKLYNICGGSYGRITAVKSLNDNRREKSTPFGEKHIETVSPDGFIMPLVYGLQALMETKNEDGYRIVHWAKSPRPFLENNLEKIVKRYMGIFSMCNYDPQKIGKNPHSYEQALDITKMVIAGLI